MGALAEGLDWRDLDGHLPLLEDFTHPDKPFRHKNSMMKLGGTIGLPLPYGWRSGRQNEVAKEADYDLHSAGRFCSNRGYPFLFESDDWPDDCEKRCTEMPTCMFFTAYLEHGWCQLSSRCVEEVEAGDPSAVTFRRKVEPLP